MNHTGARPRLGVVGGRAIGSPGTIELARSLLSPDLGGGLERMLADTSDSGVIQVLPSGSRLRKGT